MGGRFSKVSESAFVAVKLSILRDAAPGAAQFGLERCSVKLIGSSPGAGPWGWGAPLPGDFGPKYGPHRRGKAAPGDLGPKYGPHRRGKAAPGDCGPEDPNAGMATS
jgi:hypothetical protein